ncbi:MAG: hypothetical protein L0271_09370 [Gemmatimonadetes bacterium]|nr:hypothetical protein [Gemmatimonadota bacterium]
MRFLAIVSGLAAVSSTSPGLAQSLRASSSGADHTIIVFADGNLRTALGQDDAAQNASGSLGVSYRSGPFGAQFVINAVGAAEPVRDNFGASLLAPGSGNSLSAGLLELTYQLTPRASIPVCGTLMGRAYGSISSAEWVDPVTTGDNEQRFGVVSGGGGAGLRCEFFGGRVVNTPGDSPAETANEVAVFLDLGFVFRTIGGDIASVANDEVRTRLLNSSTRPRAGVEVGLGIQVNGLKAGMTFYGFAGEVPGLTDGQVVAGFSVQTTLFKGVLAAADR